MTNSTIRRRVGVSLIDALARRVFVYNHNRVQKGRCAPVYLTRPLGNQGVRQVLKRLAADAWTVDVAGRDYVARKDDAQVRFNAKTGTGDVYTSFRRVGLELDRKRTITTTKTASNGLYDPQKPFASLAYLVDDNTWQKPLVDIPGSVKNAWTFTDHALERMNERNIGVFEVYSTLHQPDHIFDDPQLGGDTPHYLRGDVEVIVDAEPRVVITVIDALGARSEQRRALAPVIEIAPTTPSTTDTSSEEAQAVATAPEAFDPHRYPSAIKATRAWILRHDDGQRFTVADLLSVLPAQWQGAARQALTSHVNDGALTRADRGAYRIAKRDRIERADVAVRSVPQRTAKHTAAEAIGAWLSALAAGQEFTTTEVVNALSGEFGESTIKSVLNGRLANGQLRLVREGATGRPRVMAIPGSDSAEPVVHDEATPEPEADVVAAVPAAAVVDDEDDYVAAVGFVFEPLPQSDVFDLVDTLGLHVDALRDSPGSWARIATYSGARALDVATKRAAKLDEALGDVHLRFVVRRLTMAGDAGLFVSWSTKARAAA